MAEKPILFNTEMVQAILDGKKIQTRRVIKPQPDIDVHDIALENNHWLLIHYAPPPIETKILDYGKCPYGVPGDMLYVKEGYTIVGYSTQNTEVIVEYSSDGKKVEVSLTHDEHLKYLARKYPYRKTAGRFMYKSLARIWLEVKDVRVERVQEISVQDIEAEGIEALPWFQEAVNNLVDFGIKERAMPEWIFEELWDSINAKRGYGWDENPYVWVVEFERVE